MPVFRAQRLHKRKPSTPEDTAGQISRKYTLGFLVKQPVSRSIVLKHLAPQGLDEERLGHIDGILREMAERNMGGGIPYSVIVSLMEELDHLPASTFENVTR